LLELEARTHVGHLALDANLRVQRGTCFALAGPSGAGKTSLVRIAAGLLRPAEGRVACDGTTWLDTTSRIDIAPERRRTGCVFQDYALFGHLTAEQNVLYALRDLPRAERRRRAADLLERFGLAGHAHRRPARLSGGERQRVAIARALARRPAVLLLDEPLSALDSRTRSKAARVLATTLAESDVPALLVTHDFLQAAQLAQRIAVIDQGRIVQEGTASELASDPASAFVADFTGAVLLLGSARPGPAGLTLVDLEGGGSIASTDAVPPGLVHVAVNPWELALEPAGTESSGSARNHVTGRVESVTVIGNRARVSVGTPQPLVAEITAASAADMHLARGSELVVTWKASATRLLER
jgi:molybdate transport system ATP-binding protein